MGIRGALVLPRAETKLAPAETEFRSVGRPPERYEEDLAGPSRAIHEPLVKRSQDVTIVGLKGTLIISRAEPDLLLTELETPKLGRLVEGFDGTVAWSHSPRLGSGVKMGEERTQALLEAGFRAEDWRQAFRSVKTVGRETLEDEPCYKVVVTPHQGEPSTQFFSVKSGLLLKTVRKTRNPKGEVAVEEVYKDYRQAGDILLPHTTIQSFANQFRTTTIQSVAWNTAIPKEKFGPPAEVQALLRK